MGSSGYQCSIKDGCKQVAYCVALLLQLSESQSIIAIPTQCQSSLVNVPDTALIKYLEHRTASLPKPSPQLGRTSHPYIRSAMAIIPLCMSSYTHIAIPYRALTAKNSDKVCVNPVASSRIMKSTKLKIITHLRP